jgi:hypothetical protein
MFAKYTVNILILLTLCIGAVKVNYFTCIYKLNLVILSKVCAMILYSPYLQLEKGSAVIIKQCKIIFSRSGFTFK